MLTASLCPMLAAQCSGVCPLSLRASTSAPYRSSLRTVAMWPRPVRSPAVQPKHGAPRRAVQALARAARRHSGAAAAPRPVHGELPLTPPHAPGHDGPRTGRDVERRGAAAAFVARVHVRALLAHHVPHPHRVVEPRAAPHVAHRIPHLAAGACRLRRSRTGGACAGSC